MQSQTDPTPTSGVRRRTLLRTSAWTAPVVVAAGAAPAAAASPPRVYGITPIASPGGTPSVQACSTVPGSTLQFLATIDGQAAPSGEEVTITLPLGLRFADGTTSATVRTGAGGVVDVPAITPYGAAGTYTLTATYQQQTATQNLTVTPQPGSVTAINRTITTSSTGATFTTTDVPIEDAVSGSIYGDQYSTSSPGAGANSAILTATGVVRYWGRDSGGTRATPGTLTYGGQPVTGMTMADNWTSIAANDNATGGVVANGSTAYQWYRSGSAGTLQVARVTGFTGTIVGVTSDNGRNYLHTTTGIWAWPTATSGTTVTLTTANRIVNSSSITAFHTWSHGATGTLTYGGAAVYGSNSIAIWRDSTTPTTVALPPGVVSAQVEKVVTSDSGLMLMTRGGDLYTRGTGTRDASGWTLRASNIADFSMWGFRTNTNYVGGVYIDAAGRAYRMFSSATGGWRAPEVIRVAGSTTPLANVVQSYSSDGTYLLLTADGKVYAVGGNTDNPGRTGAVLVNTGTGTVRDLNVWGHHIGESYHGGGFVIKGALGCA
ncbi:hypothetical protein [Kytococcus sedentarius]|uniref:hypothetical protein n=1 Tax=Kytococcus sedentarius TaxID=1276 RepID=UPI0035BBC98E